MIDWAFLWNRKKKNLAKHYTLVFDRGTRRICTNIKITKSLTKQQLGLSRVVPLSLLNGQDSFVRFVDSRCTKYKIK